MARGKRARARSIPPRPDPDERGTYLGVSVTRHEFETLGIKHQIDASILEGHGLVDARSRTNFGTAWPMLGNERRIPATSDALEEACAALLDFQPTGVHMESEHWLDDPYVWVRRGVRGRLRIKRFTQVRRGDHVGMGCFPELWVDDGSNDPNELEEDGKEGPRSTATTELEVVQEEADEADAPKQTDELSPLSTYKILNPGPLRNHVPKLIPSKSKSARLERARQMKEAEEKTGGGEDVDMPDVVESSYPSEDPTTKPSNLGSKSKAGKALRPASNVDVQDGPPSTRLRPRQPALIAGRSTSKVSKPQDRVNETRQVHQKRRLRLKNTRRTDRDMTQFTVGLPPMPNGKTVWKDQAWFNQFSAGDDALIVARNAQAHRLRMATLEAMSPLPSPLLGPVPDGDVDEIDALDLLPQSKTLPATTTSSKKRKASDDLTMAEKKAAAKLTVVIKRQCVRLDATLEAIQTESKIKKVKMKAGRDSETQPENPGAASARPAVPPFVFRAEMGPTNPPLGEPLSLDQKSVIASGKAATTKGKMPLKAGSAHIAPVTDQPRKEALSGQMNGVNGVKPAGKMRNDEKAPKVQADRVVTGALDLWTEAEKEAAMLAFRQTKDISAIIESVNKAVARANKAAFLAGRETRPLKTLECREVVAGWAKEGEKGGSEA